MRCNAYSLHASKIDRTVDLTVLWTTQQLALRVTPVEPAAACST